MSYHWLWGTRVAVPRWPSKTEIAELCKTAQYGLRGMPCSDSKNRITKNKKFSAKPNEVFEIQTGMTATVEIKTGHNTILKYLIKPLIKTTNESFIER
mgnify:CR=1 FL=1